MNKGKEPINRIYINPDLTPIERKKRKRIKGREKKTRGKWGNKSENKKRKNS